MTTKAQELKALEQIRKIVNGLGEGSYIGMAFEGCFEDAEENIENDWGLSWKQRAESFEKKWNTARNELKSEQMMADTQRKQVLELKAENKQLSDKYEYQLASINAMKQEASQETEKADKAMIELSDKLIEQSKKNEELEQEIIRLKARLYDMMMAAENK